MTTPAKKKGAHRYAGLSKADRMAARRADLIEAGIELFGTVGIAQTRIKDICHHAGLTERYFYESFPNLDDFAKTVIGIVGVRGAAQLLPLLTREDDIRALARSVMTEIARIVDEDPRIGRILLIETVQAGGALADIRAAGLTAGAYLLRTLIDPPQEGIDTLGWIADLMQQLMNGQDIDLGPLDTVGPGDVAMAGATAEILVAWLTKRLVMTRAELSTYLADLLELIVQLPAAGRTWDVARQAQTTC